MINRKLAPPVQIIKKLELPAPRHFTLSNGIPVYCVDMGTQDVIKLQLVFRAGRPFEKKRLVAKTTSRLLKEGTRNQSSAQIAEAIDFYGATLSTPTSLDHSSLVFYSLTKHFSRLIPLLTELLTEPTFPQEELIAFIENSKRRLKVDLSKNDVLAYRKITEFIFGTDHPYGYNSDEAAFNAVKRGDLLKHFQNNYNADNCYLFISGRITDDTLNLLDQYFGKLPVGKRAVLPNFNQIIDKPEKRHFEIPGSMQTAIRIGHRTIGRAHPDYAGFTVLNTILGGYFGSRLMMNVREDKGYTYNIYSTQDTMIHDSCFYVSTEVGNDFVKAARKEIYKEFARLQEDLVSENELMMVRNYMLGNMLHMVDGPFHVSDVVKTIVLNEMPFNAFEYLVDVVNDISAGEIRDLAQKHLSVADMWEVTAG